MDEAQNEEQWPALKGDDEALLKELFAVLSGRAVGDPYGDDAAFAECLASLPLGLRAMAATHWLDISLTLDSITWHFGNFGEPHLAAQTEEGLIELDLHELAECFREARDLMVPLLSQRTESDGDPYQILEKKGLRERGDEIDERAWAADNPSGSRSVIYDAWVRYARKHPERVFGA
jgi:hypothetical protein